MSIELDMRATLLEPQPGTAGGLRARFKALRNRTLANPSFQRFAARFPLTRPVARARARALFDLVAGFVYSQVAYACVQAELLPFLHAAPRSAREVAGFANLPLEGAERLLRAAAALRLAERLPDDRYTLGEQGAALIGNGGIAEMILHHDRLYADLADPLALLRRGGGGGALSAYWPYAEGETSAAETAAPYSALMAASQPMVAAQLLGAHSFKGHRRLLDVGGGQGAFLEAVGGRYPDLALCLFDLPPVAARAAERLGGRIEAIGGSFHDSALPTGADVLSLVRILHDHDDTAVAALLRKAHAALPAGGTLLIAEPMAETPGSEASGDAYFGFYLLAMGSGRPRSANVLGAMLKEAGFRRVREAPTDLPLVARVLVATA
jgi:demethylspheroidene O-methyltransferase